MLVECSLYSSIRKRVCRWRSEIWWERSVVRGGRERADVTIPAAPNKVCFASAAAQFILVMYSHIDDQGDPLIPFATYIHHEAPSMQSLPNSEIFNRFTDFPSEIQMAIFRSCDAPTLFQLMRTCSNIRAEAQKLFWSHPATWYYVEPDWLTFEYGHPGSEPHCSEFARCVQQVEVAFIRLDYEFRKSEWPHPIPATLGIR